MNTALWWLGQNTIAVAVMIPFIVVACRVFRNRPAVQHVLWLVVLLKFVTPPLVSWPWTIDHVHTSLWSSPVSHDSATVAVEPDSPFREVAGRPAMDDLVPPPEPGLGAFAPFKNAIESAVPAPAAVVPPSRCFADSRCCGVWPSAPWPATDIAGGGSPGTSHWLAARRAANRRAGRCRALLIQRRALRSVESGHLSGRPVALIWPETLSSGDVARAAYCSRPPIRRRPLGVYWLELAAGIVWWWNPLFWFMRRRCANPRQKATAGGGTSKGGESTPNCCWNFPRVSIRMPAPVLAVATSFLL